MRRDVMLACDGDKPGHHNQSHDSYHCHNHKNKKEEYDLRRINKKA